MDKKIFYLRRCRAAAEEAGRAFDMNPRVILAQGALESGWGTSCLATEHNNYFGIMGYGASNACGMANGWSWRRPAGWSIISGITHRPGCLSSISPA